MERRRIIPVVHATAAAAPAMDRRRFLQLMAASAALAGAGCSGPPQEQILPYVQMPETGVPGRPLFYASAFTRRGLAHGVLIESNMGRPTKIEGNPQHPASLGATDVFAQASILQLWDPDRSQLPYRGQTLVSWDAFQQALAAERAGWDADGGAGLRILTGSVASPTLLAQLATLRQRYPNARWHCHDPLHDDAATAAAQLAFGRPADTILRLERAELVLTLDADIFGDWPGGIAYARAFAGRRRAEAPEFESRLYTLETTPGLTGAYADNRLAAAPAQIEALAWRLAARLGVPGIGGDLFAAPNPQLARWEALLARRLAACRGRSLVVAGGALSAPTRALAHLLNAHLGNAGVTACQIAPVVPAPDGFADQRESMAALTADMRAGAVRSLFILGANPVYSAAALDFGDALAQVPFSAHLGLYRDETALRSGWHIPQAHDYEQWSDGRAWDGSASIVQPAIMPLYGGRSAHELLALLVRDGERNPHALVRRHWQRQHGADDFEAFWRTALRRGLVEHGAAPPLALTPARTLAPPRLRDGLQPIFVADPAAGAGEFSNNGWLQELPRPFTKLTWDNAAFVSAATAADWGVQTGDVVRLIAGSAEGPAAPSVEAPVWVLPGQADGTVTLPLGYGRSAAGQVGNGVGFDAYRLMGAAAGGLTVHKTGRRHVFAVTQHNAGTEGRDIVRLATLAEFRLNPGFATAEPIQRVPRTSLYPAWEYKDYKWGMAIDLNACIGCNACTIACQAENNIPVVGKEEVLRGREMHWIRVDRYYLEAEGGHEQGKPRDRRPARTAFQPVPCMHCENAPCEEVCPVGATVHDSEGLNVQVYNRCVGTRFCSNNCPYKVRRFNFLQYSNTDVDSLKAGKNPEVTVRRRGVMEKCTYCLQRVTRARLDAEKLGRKLVDGDVVTACQAVCPTEAIVFGDLNDPNSRVNRVKASPLDYALLAELNTRPRTTYAARVVNPDPELE